MSDTLLQLLATYGTPLLALTTFASFSASAFLSDDAGSGSFCGLW